MDFEIRKGERVGIIGETGSGKSTILKLLLGFYTCEQGGVKIDKQELTERNAADWRKKIGYVQQDIFLIDGSIKENVAFGFEEEEIEHTRLMNAIENAGLENFVDHLPQGIETPVGELGTRVSGGQKQRLGIARALYRGADLFVFDEATSSLDPQTEQEILKAVDQLDEKNKTILIVAHRISTLQNCDRILELKNGSINKSYKYKELAKTYTV